MFHIARIHQGAYRLIGVSSDSIEGAQALLTTMKLPVPTYQVIDLSPIAQRKAA